MSILEFRLKEIDETRSYLIEQIKLNDSITGKHKNTFKYVNRVEHLFILASKITGLFQFLHLLH